MAWFLFAGDMLVMLFMTVLVVWVSLRGTGKTLDYSAQIPLLQDRPGDEHLVSGDAAPEPAASAPERGEQHRG